MTEILAVHPRGGTVIHLYSRGYQPGRKPRPSSDFSGMCGSHIGRVDGRTAPIGTATIWLTDAHKQCGVWTPEWRWCRGCLGHAAVHLGLTEQLVGLILDAITPGEAE
jgi:hypothetical protein